jgi:two-component system chemotaxis response regulator CheB
VAWADERAAADPGRTDPSTVLDEEVAMARMDPEAVHAAERPGDPSGFGCPDCSGALFRIEEGTLVRYRCRVGHAWSSESLLARQAVELEGALWMALRSLEEKAALSADLAGRAERSGHARTAVRFHDNTQEAVRAAELVRQLITQIGDTVAAPRESDDVVEDRQNGRG